MNAFFFVDPLLRKFNAHFVKRCSFYCAKSKKVSYTREQKEMSPSSSACSCSTSPSPSSSSDIGKVLQSNNHNNAKTSTTTTCFLFTPWELASLKVIYHQFDDRHKGYLDAEDLRRVCAACLIVLTEDEFRSIVHVMDSDGDARFSFDEFVTFLALSGPEHAEAVRLREQVMRGNLAAVTAGAALGIMQVVKGKLFVLLGTLFYDPIRLFRDSFVDYAATLRHKTNVAAASSGSAQQVAPSLLAALRSHAKATHIGSSLFWLTYTIALDCAVGVSMFVTYAQSRSWLMGSAQRFQNHQRHPSQPQALSPSPASNNAITTTSPSDETIEATTMFKVWSSSMWHRFDHAAGGCVSRHPLWLEGISGGLGGGVSGILQGPCRYFATFGNLKLCYAAPQQPHYEAPGEDGISSTATRSKSGSNQPLNDGRGAARSRIRQARQELHTAFRGTSGAMFRNSLGHAAFFAAFSGSRAWTYRVCFGPHGSCVQLQRNSLRDSCVTALAGCAAGAAYRTVSLPIGNLQHHYFVWKSKTGETVGWRGMGHWVRDLLITRGGMRGTVRFAYSGFGEALVYTMPVTGVAFLAYELVLYKT